MQPFVSKSADQARDRAKRVQAACAAIAHPKTLADCQRAIAVAWGHRDWAEALAAIPGGEYLPDERSPDLLPARIDRQMRTFKQLLDLSESGAASVAYASRPSSAQVPARRATVSLTGRFAAKPTQSIDIDGPVPPGCVRVWAMSWEESERGWGERPDGHTVHPSSDEGYAFVRQYWSRQPAGIPDEYSRPAGDLYAIDLPDDDPVVTSLMSKVAECAARREGGVGIWLWKGEDHVRVSRAAPREAGGWRDETHEAHGPSAVQIG